MSTKYRLALLFKDKSGFPIVARQVTNPTNIDEDMVQSPASLSALRIRHCSKLEHRLQMRLGSGAAVAKAPAAALI